MMGPMRVVISDRAYAGILAETAEKCGVTGCRIMGGGFGGCTINLVKEDLYDKFIATAVSEFKAKFGHEPKIIEVVISDGARKLE